MLSGNHPDFGLNLGHARVDGPRGFPPVVESRDGMLRLALTQECQNVWPSPILRLGNLWFQKLPDIHLQSPSKLLDAIQGNVFCSPLGVREKCSVQLRFECQPLLRPFPFCPVHSQVITEHLPCRFRNHVLTFDLVRTLILSVAAFKSAAFGAQLESIFCVEVICSMSIQNRWFPLNPPKTKG